MPTPRSCRLFGSSAIVLLVAGLTSSPANATNEVGLGVSYDPRIPVGDFRTFAPDVGFAGFQVKWDYFFTDRLSAGIGVEYHLFRRDLETNTTQIPNGAITAPTFHYMTFWSFLPTARYYFSTREIRPYAEVGVGLSATARTVLASDLVQHDAGGALVVQPSIGVLWQLLTNDAERARHEAVERDLSQGHTARKMPESMFGLTTSITYSFTTADALGAHNVAYAGVQIGIYAKP
jgi:hypothetical protein